MYLLIYKFNFVCTALFWMFVFFVRVVLFRLLFNNAPNICFGEQTINQTYHHKMGDQNISQLFTKTTSTLLNRGVGESTTPFSGLLHFILDPNLILLSVKQGGIKYHFLSLWYGSTWDWTQVSQTIGKHSNHHAKYRLQNAIIQTLTQLQLFMRNTFFLSVSLFHYSSPCTAAFLFVIVTTMFSLCNSLFCDFSYITYLAESFLMTIPSPAVTFPFIDFQESI